MKDGSHNYDECIYMCTLQYKLQSVFDFLAVRMQYGHLKDFSSWQLKKCRHNCYQISPKVYWETCLNYSYKTISAQSVCSQCL
jgi:hypothetical protein